MFTLGRRGKTPASAQPVKPPLPVSLDLGTTKYEYKFQLGEWKCQNKDAQEDEMRINKLQYEVERLRDRIEQLEKEKVQESQTRYLVEFKNKLLLEMLATSQLDADKNSSLLSYEKLKSEALKYELASLTLEKGD